MLSGISSYLFGGASEEGHPAVATESAAALADASTRFKTVPADGDEEWTIVDTASSRGASPHRMEDNPLENLLIEHPSMSVYNRGRPNSCGIDSEQSDVDMPSSSTSSSSRHVTSRHQNRAAVTARSISSNKKSMRQAQKRREARKMARTQLSRNNKVTQYNSSSKSMRRKQHQHRMQSGRNNDRKCQ